MIEILDAAYHIMDEWISRMKLEYLPTGSPDCPLIRIFGIDEAEHETLLEGVCMLASGVETNVNMVDLFGTGLSGNCQLIIKADEHDLGPNGPSANGTFTWSLTPNGWGKVAQLIRPVTKNPGSYQWIGGENVGEVSVLFSYSTTGQW